MRKLIVLLLIVLNVGCTSISERQKSKGQYYPAHQEYVCDFSALYGFTSCYFQGVPVRAIGFTFVVGIPFVIIDYSASLVLDTLLLPTDIYYNYVIHPRKMRDDMRDEIEGLYLRRVKDAYVGASKCIASIRKSKELTNKSDYKTASNGAILKMEKEIVNLRSSASSYILNLEERFGINEVNEYIKANNLERHFENSLNDMRRMCIDEASVE